MSHFALDTFWGKGNTSPLYLPTAHSDLVLWLEADGAKTLSVADVETDITLYSKTAGMTINAGATDPAGGTGAVEVFESVDAGPTNHSILKAPTNIVDGPVYVDVWFKPATRTWAHVVLGSQSCYLDLGNQVPGTGSATAELLQTSGTWSQWRITGTWSVTNLILRPATGQGGISYQGDGSLAFYIGSGSVYGPKIHQQRLSQLNDLGPSGYHGTQNVITNQMLYRTESDGLVAFGWPDDAAKTLTHDASLATAFSGNGKPFTLIQIVQRTATGTITPDGIALTGATASLLSPQATATGVIASSYTDDTATTKSGNYTNSFPASWGSLVTIYDGANEQMILNGVADASNPTDRDVGTSTFTAFQSYTRGQMKRSVMLFSRVLSDREIITLTNGRRVKWGMSLI